MDLVDDIKRLQELIRAESCDEDAEDNRFYSSSPDSSDYDSDPDYEDFTDQFQQQTPPNIECTERNVIQEDLTDLSRLAAHLTFEEFNAINQCSDPALKQLLILNRCKMVQLKNLRSAYSSMIAQCEKNIQHRVTHLGITKALMNRKNSYGKVGFPYFVDERLFRCPANEDTLKKRRKGEININYLPKLRVWSVAMQLNLKSSIMWSHYRGQLNALDARLELAVRTEDQEDADECRKKIEELNKSWKDGGAKPPPLWEDSSVDWYSVAADKNQDFVSTDSCRAFWNLILHPDINKEPYTTDENSRLMHLAEKYKFQNWDVIAKWLGTNRSPYLLCVHYYSKLTGTETGGRFTEEEDEFLSDLVETNRIGNNIPWSKVAYYLNNRSRNQLYNRYRYRLKNSNKKQGRFTHSEDVVLLCLVQKFGEDFEKVSREMPHRSQMQLRARYREYLKRKDMIFGSFTEQEDTTILDFVKENGTKSWTKLATILNRNRAHLRHRHSVLVKHLANGKKIGEVPKRQVGRNQSNYVVEILKSTEHYLNTDTMPQLDPFDIKVKSSKGRPTRPHIDSKLIDFFRSTAHIKKARTLKCISEENIRKCANTMQTLLNMLGVQLEIPDVEIYQDDNRLTEIDYSILPILAEGASGSRTEEVDIPPNVHTVQLLRCLISMCVEYRNSFDCMPCTVEFGDDMAIFEERFCSLLRWPCIMSLVPPEDSLINETPLPRPAPLKRIGRPKRNNDKIRKMNMARFLKRNTELALEAAQEALNEVDNSPVHKKLIDYFKAPPLSYTVMTQKSLEESVAIVEEVLRITGAQLTIPNNLKNRKIDLNDRQILGRLIERNVCIDVPDAKLVVTGSTDTIAMPPNVASASVVRYMFSKFHRSKIQLGQADYDSNTDCVLFRERFKKLFEWTSLLLTVKVPKPSSSKIVEVIDTIVINEDPEDQSNASPDCNQEIKVKCTVKYEPKSRQRKKSNKQQVYTPIDNETTKIELSETTIIKQEASIDLPLSEVSHTMLIPSKKSIQLIETPSPKILNKAAKTPNLKVTNKTAASPKVTTANSSKIVPETTIIKQEASIDLPLSEDPQTILIPSKASIQLIETPSPKILNKTAETPNLKVRNETAASPKVTTANSFKIVPESTSQNTTQSQQKKQIFIPKALLEKLQKQGKKVIVIRRPLDKQASGSSEESVAKKIKLM